MMKVGKKGPNRMAILHCPERIVERIAFLKHQTYLKLIEETGFDTIEGHKIIIGGTNTSKVCMVDFIYFRFRKGYGLSSDDIKHVYFDALDPLIRVFEDRSDTQQEILCKFA